MHLYTYKKSSILTLKKIRRSLGIVSILVGVFTLIYFFFPLLSLHIYLSSVYATNEMETPLPKRFVLTADTSIGELISNRFSGVGVDYKDARNWFPNINHENSGAKVPTTEEISEYFLSIPSQKIEKAKVLTNDFDLSKHLVQYFSTSKNPTEKGTSVIFGHSTLPQLFNPRDYTAIFANMHKIKNGDEILLNVNNKDFKYKVFSLSITNPEDPNIFSQSFDNSYITIITCTPPGTTWKRLVVRASLVD